MSDGSSDVQGSAGDRARDNDRTLDELEALFGRLHPEIITPALYAPIRGLLLNAIPAVRKLLKSMQAQIDAQTELAAVRLDGVNLYRQRCEELVNLISGGVCLQDALGRTINGFRASDPELTTADVVEAVRGLLERCVEIRDGTAS